MSNRKHISGYPSYLIYESGPRTGQVDTDHPEYNYWMCRMRFVDWTYELHLMQLEFQDYKCAITGEPLNLEKRTVSDGVGPFDYQLDHDHKYGPMKGKCRPGLISVRGYITQKGNEMIGDVERMGKNHPDYSLEEYVGRDSVIGQYLFNPPAQQMLKQHGIYVPPPQTPPVPLFS